MMKKWLQLLSPLIVVVFILIGCSDDAGNTNQGESTNNQTETEDNNTQSEANEEEQVSITISEDDGEEVHAEEKVDVEEGAILMDVLDENFDIEEDDGFITAIDGIENDEEEGKYWMYDVNDEMAQVGADEFELSPGDDVVFDLQVAE